MSSETADGAWSPEPSSGYCSTDEEHLSYSLRTRTGTGNRSDRRLSESSGGISSKSLLSMTLCEALALTLSESPPPSPPPDDALPAHSPMHSSSSPVSFVDYESSFGSAGPAPPNDDFPGIVLPRPHIYSLPGREEPCSNRSWNFEKQRGVETRTVRKETDQILTSQNFQIDFPSLKANSVHDLSDYSSTHSKLRLQHMSCFSENNDLFHEARSQTNSRMCKTAIANEVRKELPEDIKNQCERTEFRKEQCELPEALLSAQLDGSLIEETVENDDTVYLVAADGSLRKLLPIAETHLSSSIAKEKIVFTPPHHLPNRLPHCLPHCLPHRLPHHLLGMPKIDPRKSFNASSPEHSTGFSDETDLRLSNPEVFNPKLCVTKCHESLNITVDTDLTGSSTLIGSTKPIGPSTPKGSATPIGYITPMGSETPYGPTTSTVPPIPTVYTDSMDLRAFRRAVGFFHSYAAVEKTSCHSTAVPINHQPQDLQFTNHGVDQDLGHDPIVQTHLIEAQPTLPSHSQGDLHDLCESIWSTAAANEVPQERIDECDDVYDESSRSENGSSSVDRSRVQTTFASKRSRSSYRQNSKRRRRLSSPVLAELEDHGYSLKATYHPASLRQSSAGPCAADVGEETTSTAADASSILAKLLLTGDRLFPNEGSDGFIARRHCPGSESSAESSAPGGQELSGSLLERLLTGEIDHEVIKRSEERIIRDRVQERIDDGGGDVEEDVDLRLQDFDPGSLELENLEELWKNYGDLLGAANLL